MPFSHDSSGLSSSLYPGRVQNFSPPPEDSQMPVRYSAGERGGC